MVDFVRLLTREEIIAGLEVRDTHVRVALFRTLKNEKTTTYDLEFFGEEELEKGVIVEGIIVNAPALEQAVRSAIKKSKRNISYVVLTLPASIAYYKTFSFPKNISKEKREESMHIASEFQLPVSPLETYVDWETTQESRDGTVDELLIAGKKQIIDSYLTLLSKLHIHVIAVETHPQSIARVIPKNKKPELFSIQETTSTTLMIVQNGALQTVRVLPKLFFDSGGVLSEEMSHVSDFYESEFEERPIQSELRAIRLDDRFTAKTKEIMLGDLSSVVGAGVRGAEPRNTDFAISLIPVGTEEAYELEKAKAFTGLITNLSLAVMLFFIMAYAGAWFILVQIQNNITNRISTAQSIPMPQETVEFQDRASTLNNYLLTTDQILQSSPRWSIILGSILQTIPQGVSVYTATFPSYNSGFSFTGVAASRPILNGMRSAFETKPEFMSVSVPLSNLDKTSDIPFGISFQLREPNQFTLFTND